MRHLLSTWWVCRREWGQIWEGSRLSFHGRAFDRLLPRLSERVQEISRERQRLPGLIARLRACPPGERRAFLQSDRDFRSWLFCEWLIEESQGLLYADPGRAEELAAGAVTLAGNLDPGLYSDSLVNDLRARSWAFMGEVLRVLSELRRAEEAFATAEDFIFQGTGDVLEEARLLELKA
ncbi:MAG TPA: hypothetical protein VGG03_14335, partial [Thermoanaerobaculia bacterium]